MTCKCKCSSTDNWPQVEAESKAVLPAEIVQYIEECRQGEHPESHLIGILHRVQEHFGHLGFEQMNAVAQLLRVPTARVTGVATFYHIFRTSPRGKYLINVCLGTACYVNGAKQVASRFKEELGIDFGQTTPDGQFTLQSTCCLGTCGLGPVVTINEQVYPKVQPEQIPVIIRKVVDEGKKGKEAAAA